MEQYLNQANKKEPWKFCMCKLYSSTTLAHFLFDEEKQSNKFIANLLSL